MGLLIFLFEGPGSSTNSVIALISHYAYLTWSSIIRCWSYLCMFVWSLLVSAKITGIKGVQTVHEGSNLQLTCEASGRPEPNITWVKQMAGNQGNTGVQQEGKVLTITKNQQDWFRNIQLYSLQWFWWTRQPSSLCECYLWVILCFEKNFNPFTPRSN